MCGIVYSKNFSNKPVNKTILKRYKAQRSRGIDGFGFYIPSQNRLVHNTREHRIINLLKSNKANEILFHHRWPTSTLNVQNACHPFSSKDHFKHNYITVHNGVLQNEYTLWRHHTKDLGIKYVSETNRGSLYTTFNDSEALAYDIALYLEGKQDKLTAQGSIAFITIQRDSKGKAIALYFGRNLGSPLMLKMTTSSITLSSEGKGVLIEPDKLYRFDYKTYVLTKTPLEIPEYKYTTYQTSGKLGFTRPNDNLHNNVYTDEYTDDFDLSPKSGETIADEYLLESDYSTVFALENIEIDLESINKKIADFEANYSDGTTTDAELDEADNLLDQAAYLSEAKKILEDMLLEYSDNLAEDQNAKV